MTENIISSLLHDDYAVTFAPALEQDISDTNLFLQKHNRGTLPPDYLHLLRQSDGLSYNGIELYGTRANDRETMGYTLPGLIEANLEYANVPQMRGKLLLGRASEEIFVYDTMDQKYHILERLDFQVSCSFQTFSEAVYLFVDELF